MELMALGPLLQLAQSRRRIGTRGLADKRVALRNASLELLKLMVFSFIKLNLSELSFPERCLI